MVDLRLKAHDVSHNGRRDTEDARLKTPDSRGTRERRHGRARFFWFLGLVFCFSIVSCSPHIGISRPTSQPPAGLRTALLPFENNSGSRGAVKVIMPMVRDYLIRSGYRLLDTHEIEEFLVRNRIRRTGEISWEDLVVVGAVEVFSEIDQPQTGLSCRFVDPVDGHVLWAESIGLAGDDFTTILGFGTVQSLDVLAIKAVESLFRTIGKIRVGEEPRLFVSHQAKKEFKVALLPFENLSGRRAAGRIILNVFVARLAMQSPYGVVEPGEVREQLIRLKVRYLETLGADTISELGREVAADYLLLGTVLDYREEIKEGYPPRVATHLRLVDVENGRAVWAGGTSMTGDDSIIVLDLGEIRSIIPLAEKAADKLIKNMVKRKIRERKWRSAGDLRWKR
jgi:TolB-like protein